MNRGPLRPLELYFQYMFCHLFSFHFILFLQVSWRSKKLGVITEGSNVRQKPDKFRLQRTRNSDWSLLIQYVEMVDKDTYTCNAGTLYSTEIKLTVEGAIHFSIFPF